MYGWGLKASICPLEILMGWRTGNKEWDVWFLSSAPPAHITRSFLLLYLSPLNSITLLSSNSLTSLPHKPLPLLLPLPPTALVKLSCSKCLKWLCSSPFSSWRFLACCSHSAPLCCCVLRLLRWTAVLTKCQRRSSDSTRTQRALKGAAGHLSITSALSQIIGADI